MTLTIALVLGILLVALVLFVTEWVRMDIVALLVLGSLALTGVVTPREALAGFSNPAVVTVWAMFMLSAGLTRTGVAGIIGRQVLRLAGQTEARMAVVIMLTAGSLSAFMNNIGVAALLLPVVMDVARRLGKPPSRLLMPLAYGSLLGGLTTLIGTPPNLLVAEALRENGLEPFRLFDYTPVGGAVFLGGVAFVALAGRHLLPSRDIARETSPGDSRTLAEQYALHERTVVMRVRDRSRLIDRSLKECRFGFATGLNVIAVIRGGRSRAAPGPDFVLQANDRLMVEGRLDRLNELRSWRELIVEREAVGLESLMSNEVALAELRLLPSSPLIDRSLRQVDFRNRFGTIVLALRRDSEVQHSGLADLPLQPDDRLLVQGDRTVLDDLRGSGGFAPGETFSADDLAHRYHLQDRLFTVRVPAESVLVGESLAESRLGDALGLGVLGVIRHGATLLVPGPETTLEADDRLIVRGKTEDLEVFRGLQELDVEEEAPRKVEMLESERVGMVEAILAPRSSLPGKTLRNLVFRERYGLQAVAILREGRVFRSGLREMPLRFGDALLLFGPREKLALLAGDVDFVVLSESPRHAQRTGKAGLAALIMAAVVAPVIAGWLPISIAAVVGATLMVLTGCLAMEDAYRSVDWRSIFLIAGMLPLGVAMQQTGAAHLVADQVLVVAGPLGPWGVIAGLYLLTAAATMIVPTAALVVLMAPIAIQASTDLGVSPYAVMMAVAMAASASFTSPISHPANLLVMGPGGYRFSDYLRVGVPLTLVVFVVTLVVLPFFWPLQG